MVSFGFEVDFGEILRSVHRGTMQGMSGGLGVDRGLKVCANLWDGGGMREEGRCLDGSLADEGQMHP